MLAEVAVGEVLLAPIVVYAIVATVIFALLRLALGLIGLRRLAWHPALFELALYVAVLSLLVRYF